MDLNKLILILSLFILNVSSFYIKRPHVQRRPLLKKSAVPLNSRYRHVEKTTANRYLQDTIYTGSSQIHRPKKKNRTRYGRKLNDNLNPVSTFTKKTKISRKYGRERVVKTKVIKKLNKLVRTSGSKNTVGTDDQNKHVNRKQTSSGHIHGVTKTRKTINKIKQKEKGPKTINVRVRVNQEQKRQQANQSPESTQRRQDEQQKSDQQANQSPESTQRLQSEQQPTSQQANKSPESSQILQGEQQQIAQQANQSPESTQRRQDEQQQTAQRANQSPESAQRLQTEQQLTGHQDNQSPKSAQTNVQQGIPGDLVDQNFRISTGSSSIFAQAVHLNQLDQDHVEQPEFVSSIQPIESFIIGASPQGAQEALGSPSRPRCAACEFFHKPAEGLVRTEGDVVMEYNDYVIAYGVPTSSPVNRTKRALLPPRRNKQWPGNLMPIDADDSFSRGDVDQAIAALREWNRETCMKFRDVRPADVTSNVPRVRLTGRDSGCYSFIGRQGGQQIIQLTNKCRRKRVIIHEIGHAIGLFHEQVRSDRDQFVTINFNNIPDEFEFNFRKVRDAVSLGVPYDYLSIMHYSEKAFSSNPFDVSIRTTDRRYQKIIGRATNLSFRDVKQTNLLIGCANHCPRRSCPGEGFLDKNCQCRCPSRSGPTGPCTGRVLGGNDPQLSRVPLDGPDFVENVRTIENFRNVTNRLNRNGTNTDITPVVDLPSF